MKIAVVIPCWRVKRHILDVIAGMGPIVHRIFVVDDACPEDTGNWVLSHCRDPRVSVLRHEQNQGVGGAVITGYREAAKECCDIAVKVDGDGQMDPELISHFVEPILQGRADYTTGNRFYRLESLDQMPRLRLFGNACLSFVAKISCGYWNLMDPTNGYTALHVAVLRELPLDKIDKRYFFETDMLFRLNTIRAVVKNVPMSARYGDEVSGLKISKLLPEFALKHLRCMFRRYVYNYWLRDVNVGTLYSFFGFLLMVFGVVAGAYIWVHSILRGTLASSGTVMLAALPTLIGIQFLIAFVHHDIANVPQEPLHPQLLLGHSRA
jgi:dolichol-phosphate mannosyltransferase